MLKILLISVLIVHTLVFIADILFFISLVIDSRKRLPKEEIRKNNSYKRIGAILVMIIISLIPIVNLLYLAVIFMKYEQILKKCTER